MLEYDGLFVFKTKPQTLETRTKKNNAKQMRNKNVYSTWSVLTKNLEKSEFDFFIRHLFGTTFH